VLAEATDFPDAPYLEFGWGNAEYYPARQPGWELALRAALVPAPAVLHLAGLPDHPRRVFPRAEIVELALDADGFRRLIAYLDGGFACDPGARLVASSPGLHGFSAFYAARGEFDLFNTCNTWIAAGLAAAGLRVQVSGTLTAGDLMRQIR